MSNHKSAQSNKGDTNDIDDFYDKVFEHAFRLGQELPTEKTIPHDPCNAEDKLVLRHKIAQEANKARLDEVQRLVNAVHRGDEPNTYVRDRYFELKQLTADKESKWVN